MEDSSKPCIVCGKILPATLLYFCRKSTTKSGLMGRCKLCLVKSERGRRKVLADWRRTADAKICTRCDDLKVFADFYKSGRSYDGLTPWCIACQKRYYDENRESINLRHRLYGKANAEHVGARKREYYEEYKEEILAGQRRYYLENTDAVKARARSYRQNNRETVAERSRLYGQANRDAIRRQTAERRRQSPEQFAAHSRNYTARKKAADGRHDHATIIQMYDDQQGLCAYCETVLFGTYHVDHVVPLCRGGSNDWGNLAVTCPTCNLSKGAKTPLQFLKTLGYNVVISEA